MTPRLEKLAWVIMDAMADDWESLEQILPSTTKFCGCDNIVAVAEEIVSLIDHGFIEEMEEPTPLTPEQIVDYPREFWFRMTESGRVVWESDAAFHYTD